MVPVLIFLAIPTICLAWQVAIVLVIRRHSGIWHAYRLIWLHATLVVFQVWAFNYDLGIFIATVWIPPLVSGTVFLASSWQLIDGARWGRFRKKETAPSSEDAVS